MSIRKRKWTNKDGPQEAWVVDYADQEGVRRLKTFKRLKGAKEFRETTGVHIRQGTHVAESASKTVKQAVELWIETAKQNGLERTTVEGYQRHARLHILPLIGREKLAKVSMPFVRAFQDRLHDKGCSPGMIKAVTQALGAILADAQDRGLAAHNAVRERSRQRRSNGSNSRHKEQIKEGKHFPTPEEIRAIIAAANERWRPLLMTAILTGLRASELRGLRWEDVDVHRHVLHVCQRADRYNAIGSPKSRAGTRDVPITPQLVQVLREWKLRCPKKDGRLAFVFPNGRGNIETLNNIVERAWLPTQLTAGVTETERDAQGNQMRDQDGHPLLKAKYTGFHTLRHFFASWCINEKQRGGLELPGKVVQERMGHATLAMTMDRYGHLFPRGDDKAELAAGEAALLLGSLS
jgi:integrase